MPMKSTAKPDRNVKFFESQRPMVTSEPPGDPATSAGFPIPGSDDFDIEEVDDGTEGSTVADLTGKFKQPSGVVKLYKQPAEWALAMFAVTKLVNQFGKLVRNSRAINGEPSVTSIGTDVRTVTTVYCDLCSTLEFDRGDGKPPAVGMVQTIMMDEGYRVAFAAPRKEWVVLIEKAYNKMMEAHNFYQGRTLRFGREAVEFIPVPSTRMDDAILPKATTDEISLNVLQFLTNPKMHAITKKRGMLFYGPPGTGKTTSIKAMFKALSDQRVTCVYVSDASFDKQSVEDVFGFINKYLAPALVVFEDIDLIAPDRRDGGSRLIGPLLSALNGIEEQKKPIAIVATTNRVEVLDAAVTRPCRFDRRIKVDYPSETDMHTIFRNVAGFDAPPGCFKAAEPRLTGAHVEEIYRTAALLAEQQKRPVAACVCEAVETVRKHFMIVSPKVKGFGGDDLDGVGGSAPSSEGAVPSKCLRPDAFRI